MIINDRIENSWACNFLWDCHSIELYDLFLYHYIRMVAPDVFDCLENPWKLRHIFTCKQDKLKDYYGKYSINKPKSELIVEGSKEYFQVS